MIVVSRPQSVTIPSNKWHSHTEPGSEPVQWFEPCSSNRTVSSAVLFSWVVEPRVISIDQAMRCAKREPGRSWEALESELNKLGEP